VSDGRDVSPYCIHDVAFHESRTTTVIAPLVKFTTTSYVRITDQQIGSNLRCTNLLES
jgi:hypothetical protein